jgi:hypothetical protein
MAILRKPEHFWPTLWIGVLVALAAIVALEHFFGGVTAGTGPRAPARIVEARLLPPFALPPEPATPSETVAKPLFVPTRRPSPPLATAATPTMRKGQFVLTGVTIVPDVAFAFLRETASGKTLSVKKGNMVNGITIDVVEPRRVVLRMGEETEELALNIQVPARMATAPAPVSGTPPAAVPGQVPQAPPAFTSPAGGLPGAVPGAPAAGLPAPPGEAPAATPATPSAQGPVSGRRRPWINPQ